VGSDVRQHPAHPVVVVRRGRRVLRTRWDVLLVIAAGGVLGSSARYGAALVLPHAAAGVPWATLLVNVIGCLLIGVLMTLVLRVWPPSRYVRPFLGTGVLGGFTTFSSYALDVHTLMVAGEPRSAFGYLFGSLFAGLVAVWLGMSGTLWLVGVLGRRTGTRRWRRSW
jgi:CrcB protein